MLYLFGFHSLVLGKVAVFLVDAVIDDTTRDVDGTVTSTRDAFVIVAPLDNVV